MLWLGVCLFVRHKSVFYKKAKRHANDVIQQPRDAKDLVRNFIGAIPTGAADIGGIR